MEDLLARAMNLAVVRGAQYADIRAVHNVTESVFMKNGIVENVNLLYAKDYKVFNDLNILLKGFKNLGRRVI